MGGINDSPINQAHENATSIKTQNGRPLKRMANRSSDWEYSSTKDLSPLENIFGHLNPSNATHAYMHLW